MYQFNVSNKKNFNSNYTLINKELIRFHINLLYLILYFIRCKLNQNKIELF